MHTTLGGLDHVADQPLAAGANDVEWTLTVDRPDLWWPRALGDATLHDLARAGACSTPTRAAARPTSASCAPGLRQVRMRSWIASVNGERLFLKGSNHGPTRMALAEATPDELARDVELACDAGLDLLRVHAHITRPELYDAADEAGLLLWQDLPLQWGYARGIRKQAVRQADRGRRPARPPPVDRDLVRPQRADGHRERPRRCGATRRRSGAWP